jgi:PPM family protein phosphatase
MRLTLRYAARSDVGLVREGNEDSGYAGPHLLAVADGMGGHAAGEVASSVVIATLAPLDEDAPRHDLLDALAATIEHANQHLHDIVQGDDALDGMGTTLTALLRSGSRLGLAHVGDSRAYLLRDGELSQITRDHTYVQSLVDQGRISAEEADHHPQRALLTRAIDGRVDMDIDLSIREARAGDRYLLCSDGLSGVVSAETLRDTLATGTPADAVAGLVDLALRGGGPDNVTCIVADVVDVDATPNSVPVTVGAVGGSAEPDASRRQDHAASRAAALTPSPDRRTKPPADQRAAEPPHPRRLLRAGIVLAAVLLLIGTLGWAVWSWTRNQYYVGGDRDRVAIFQGLPQQVVGISLSDVYEVQDVPLQDLPVFERQRVRENITARDLDDARKIVTRLDQQAETCRQARAAAPTPRPTPTATPAPTPATTPAPTPATTPAPSVPAGCAEEAS